MLRALLLVPVLMSQIPPNPPPTNPDLRIKGGHGWVKWTSTDVIEVFIQDQLGNTLSTDLPPSSNDMPQNRMSWPAGDYVMVGVPSDPRRPYVYRQFTVN